jgi:hypothetical protein
LLDLKTRPLFHKDLQALSNPLETIIFHVWYPGKPSIYRHFEHGTLCNPLILGFCGYLALLVLILQEVMSDRRDFEQHLSITDKQYDDCRVGAQELVA